MMEERTAHKTNPLQDRLREEFSELIAVYRFRGLIRVDT
jgi:hypothetical protein